jgi:hypothetical protein
MIEEAIKAGVLRATKKRIARNPNKWAKHMAPWFNERCRTARTRYRAAAQKNGKVHAHTQEALKKFG